MAKKARNKKTWCYKRLSKCCCRLTKPRMAILDILSYPGRHYTAEQIHAEAAGIYPSVGLATIYRNLELLVRIGLVWKFDTGNGRAVYETADCPEESHHHHLICKKCNSIIDYSDKAGTEKRFIREREQALAKEYDFAIENHSIDFYGLCSACRRAA